MTRAEKAGYKAYPENNGYSTIGNVMYDYNAEKRRVYIAGYEKVISNAWKDAQSDDLPEIDKEVIVLCQDYEDDPSYLRVSYGHRPNPDGWDGKSYTSDEITHYEPMLYDKGGWNQPNVKWWLDIELPIVEDKE